MSVAAPDELGEMGKSKYCRFEELSRMGEGSAVTELLSCEHPIGVRGNAVPGCTYIPKTTAIAD